MASTTTANGARPASTSTTTRLPAVAPDTGARRDRSKAAAGALVLTVCTLGALLIYGRVGHRQAVLAMARTVEVGQVVDLGDLRTVHVSADPGVRTVPVAQRSQIVGRPAAVRLLAGTMLSAAQVGDATGLPKGMALVGAVLKPGQYPLGLAPGDAVTIVVTGSSGSTTRADQSQSGPPTATVVAVAPAPDATGSTAASLQVPVSSAPAVAEAGAAGQLSLVVIGR